MTTLWRYSLYQQLTDIDIPEVSGEVTERTGTRGGGGETTEKYFSELVTSNKASISFTLTCLLALIGSKNSHNRAEE